MIRHWLLRAPILLLLGCGACTSARPASFTPAAEQPHVETSEAVAGARLAVPAVRRTQLPNGLRVIFIEVPWADTVHLAVAARAAADFGPTQFGLAALTAATMRAGFVAANGDSAIEGLPFDDVELLQGRSGTQFRLTVSADQAETGFAALSRMLIQPRMDETSLQRAKREAKASTKQESTEPITLLSRVGAEELFGRIEPFAHFTFGTKTERAGFTEDSVRSFFSSRYQPSESALLVVGPLSQSKVIQLARMSFEAWTPGPNTPVVQTEVNQVVRASDRAAAVGIPASGPVARVVMLASCPPRAADDTLAADITATLLAQRTQGRLRHAGESYGATARCAQARNAGIFQITFDSQLDAWGGSLDLALAELARMRGTGADASELAGARAWYLGNYATMLSTSAGLLAMLADQFLNDLPDDYYATLEGRVNRVNAYDIAAFGTKYLAPERVLVVASGSRAVLESPLSQLGKIRWVDLPDATEAE